MDFLLYPPVAFLMYIPLVLAIAGFGKLLAGPSQSSELKESVYTGGEEGQTGQGVPGYKPFFLIAFFFAILHLGALVIGLGALDVSLVPYIIGLILVLLVLILG